jgi:acyl dehydratase
MSIPASIVGASAGPLASLIEPRWLMAYSAALGERESRYYDTGRPGGVLAHPLFPVCYEWPLVLALRERAGLQPLDARVVHAQHDLVLHRPLRAGEALSVSSRVVAAVQRRPGALIVSRHEARDAAGEPVTTTVQGSLYRGVELEGGRGSPEDPPAMEGSLNEAGRIAVRATLAHVYTECARIWNPIHTDLAYARSAGLPGPILHGTATLALAVSALLEARGARPERVRRVRCRFGAMVPMPATLTLFAHHEAAASSFEVALAHGERAIARGTIDLV